MSEGACSPGISHHRAAEAIARTVAWIQAALVGPIALSASIIVCSKGRMAFACMALSAS